MSLQKISDIEIYIQARLIKKRIQIVESRLIRKTSLLHKRRLNNNTELTTALGQQLFDTYDKEYYMTNS